MNSFFTQKGIERELYGASQKNESEVQYKTLEIETVSTDFYSKLAREIRKIPNLPTPSRQ